MTSAKFAMIAVRLLSVLFALIGIYVAMPSPEGVQHTPRIMSVLFFGIGVTLWFFGKSVIATFSETPPPPEK